MSIQRYEIRLESPEVDDVEHLHVVALEGEEAIGELFCFDIEVELRRRDGRLDLEKVRGARIGIVFEDNGELKRRIWGVVVHITDRLNQTHRWRRYAIRVAPRMHALTLVHASDIHMDRSAIEVIEDKLGRHLPTDAFETNLLAQYPQREFVVQYQESDLAFVSRLAEHLGVWFYFVFGDDIDEGDKVVLCDSMDGYPELGEHLQYQERHGRGLNEIEVTCAMVYERCVVKDYNYRTPTVELTYDEKVGRGFSGGYFEYASHHKNEPEGKHLATVRAEEMGARELIYRAESDRMHLMAGHVVSIDGHAELADTRLLITRLKHSVRLRKPRGDEDVREIDRGYENTFEAIPANRTFRPARKTPKPHMAGYFTGLIEPDDHEVIGPSAELDDWGRYRVRILFDIEPRDGHSSKPIRMAQPHAGTSHGMHFPLRPGVEVAIVFANGDPDRPIIVGALPNPVSPSPTVDKNSRHNILSTASGLRITMRDSR